MYDQSSIDTVEEDIRTVAAAWFAHEVHNSVDEFICELPLQYIDFGPHDHYSGPATYEMRPLVRVFLLKAVHGWDHETALIEYLDHYPPIQSRLNFETIPDQATLWRTWHDRFSAALQEMIQKAAQIILVKVDTEGVDIPRDPSAAFPHREREKTEDDGCPDRQVLDKAADITDQVSHIIYPAFSLNRRDDCEIHTNAFWDLQTYLGLRENLAANEGARSFLYDSRRDRTPLGHVHRSHIRDLSVESIREMYHESLERLIDRLAETDAFSRTGTIAIDITEAEPFTGDRTDHKDEIIGTKDANMRISGQPFNSSGKASP